MRRGAAQLFGGDRVIGLNGLSGLRKESSQHAPKMRAGDAGITVFPQTANEGRLRIPPLPANWQLTLCQVLVQRRIRERRQGYLTWLATFANQMQPVVTVLVEADITKNGVDQFAGAQARGVAEVEHEAQALRRRLGPAIGPHQAVRNGAQQQPSPLGKTRAVSSAGREA